MFYFWLYLVSTTLGTMEGSGAIVLEPFKLTKIEEIYKISEKNEGMKLNLVYPQEKEPSDPSYVWIGYTPNEFIVYVKNFQKGINATARRKDSSQIESDDFVGVTIDTLGRGNEAYTFMVNAIGTQGDGIKTTAGNLEWDGDWKVITQITDYGWEATFMIPFKTLSFSSSSQIWGIDIIRVRPAENRFHRLVNSVDFQSLAGNLIDLKIDFSYIKEKSRTFAFTIIPSIRVERTLDKEIKKEQISAGVTSRVKRGMEDMIDFTVKPDFSEVDVDIQEVSYDRLPINYPEKRLFFLEGSELLSSPFGLIRTRNIASPKNGIKFYTKGKNYTFSTLFLDDSFYKDMFWGRFTYTPIKNLIFGTFYSASNIGYNIGSLDLTYTLTPLNSVLIGEVARKFDTLSSYYKLNFSRIVYTGLSLIFSYEDIDKNFINPLNEIYFNFDNIRKFEFISVISQPAFKETKNLIFKPGIVYFLYQKKDDKKTLYENFLTNFMVIRGPLTFNIGYEKKTLNYLEMDTKNKEMKDYFVYLCYQKSSSQWGDIFYFSGKYLGGPFKAFSSGIFWAWNINIGIKINYFKTLYDNLRLLQVYSEVPIAKNLLIKPYLGYTIDKLNENKLLTANVIVAYEPTSYTKIYFVVNKKMHGEGKNYSLNNLNHLYEKEIIKLQFSMNF